MRRLISLVIGSLLLWASPAMAQWICPEASSPHQARRLAGQAFNEGERLYSEGRLEDAIDRFECSYSLVRHPNTLYNIARTAHEAGNLPVALSTYRSYLEQHDEGEDRLAVERAIDEIEATLTTEQATASDEEPQAETPHQLDEEPPRISRARLAAWISLATGLVVAGVGGGFWAGAYSVGQEIQADWLPTETPDSRNGDVARGQALEAAGWVLMGAGLASMIASILLFAAFPAREQLEATRSQRPRLGFMASGEGFGLVLSGGLGDW